MRPNAPAPVLLMKGADERCTRGISAMRDSTKSETKTGLGAFPRDVMADEVIEISDDMLLELVNDEEAPLLATPPPLPRSS
jgi:hypothetical protein